MPIEPNILDRIPHSLSDLPAGIVILNNIGCITLEGKDSESFLQGQLSNDIASIKDGSCQLSGYLNPKGRTLALFFVLQEQNQFHLLLPKQLVEPIAKRLTLYKMRAEVKVSTEESRAIVGTIHQHSLSLPDKLKSWEINAVQNILFADDDLLKMLIQGNGNPLHDDIWTMAGILSGRPQIYSTTSEEFIPQHINLDLIDGVSFTKGCYPGQEIVARLRYLGKLKQRMITAYVDSVSVLPGDPLFTAKRAEQKSGMVINAASLDTATLISAMVPAEYIDAGDIHLGSMEGALLTRLPMPYTITLEKI